MSNLSFPVLGLINARNGETVYTHVKFEHTTTQLRSSIAVGNHREESLKHDNVIWK